MSATKSTLASCLTVETRDDVKSRRDVEVRIVNGNKTYIVVSAPGVDVTLSLTGAERIALIEALGGVS